MRKILYWGAFALAGLVTQAPVQAQNDAPALNAEVKSLDKWLGSDANAKTWRSYLLLKELQAEVGGDREANPAVLVEAWRRFNSGEAGLEGARFQKVRVALDEYINNRTKLARAQVAAAVKDAKFAAPANDVVTKAQTELRQAAAAVQTQVKALPAAQRAYFDLPALQAIASGKGDDAQLAALGTKLAKYRWLVYDKEYIDAVAKLKAEKKLEAIEVADLALWNETKVEGLAGAAFSRLRTAIRRVQDLNATTGLKDGEGSTKTLLEKLAADVAKSQENLRADAVPKGIDPKTTEPLPFPAAVEAADTLGKLQRTGQAGGVTREVVAGYSLPNLVVYASQDFFAGGLQQEIDRVRPVSDNILGTSVSGTAHVVGATTVDMLTNPLQAGYLIKLGATANSNTIGYNGPVVIYSTGVTQLSGQKKIHFDDEIGGMQPSPATASASTCTTINSICARSRLIERIAWKRASASKAEAEAIASQHAAANLSAEMDSQGVDSTNKINKGFEEKYRRPLIIRGEYPKQFLTATSANKMQVVLSQASAGQLGAPTTPPQAPEGDIAAQVHESFVMNYAHAMLAGQTYTALEMRQMQAQMGGEVPSLEKLAKERRYESANDAVAKLAGSLITFDEEIPLRVEFRGGHVLIVMRVKQLERVQNYGGPKDERQVMAKGIEVTALYELKQVDGDWVLERDKMGEDVEEGGEGQAADIPDVRRGVYSARFSKERSTLVSRTEQAKFTNRMRRDVFPIVIKVGPMDFSKKKSTGANSTAQNFGNWSKLPPLPTTTAKSAEGWLTLAWTLPAASPKATEQKPAEKAEAKPAEPAK
ncbi:hypothetical protein [Anatilimnocola floriformis]|uniref:hypothetical protein n=1 Tax=Anatilimnocola floriformis TaxID=2948575 RepID=UPI0020C34FDD|nr:hypothetical protein [Anatilimnocola floriformis]